MWERLPDYKKEEYKRMILAFASLTDVFAQKSDSDSGASSPIINSKYQETVFQKAFGATAEDIGNTSFDAAINLRLPDNKEIKYLVGIKTFGIGAGQQKIAQFKAMNDEWSSLIDKMKKNSRDTSGKLKSKDEINTSNADLYKALANAIAKSRNQRIKSSEANIKGFSIDADKDNVESVYHVLMPSKKGDPPNIFVGEISYNEIDIDNIQIIGCARASNPTNFDFTDGNHLYHFSSADNQLFMDFNNTGIIQETWTVKYAEDAYSIFSEIFDRVYGKTVAGNLDVPSHTSQEKPSSENKFIMEPFANSIEEVHERITESYSWKILNKEGEVERYSGFNAFYGLGSKLSNENRIPKLNRVIDSYKDQISSTQLETIRQLVKEYITDKARTSAEKEQKEQMRDKIEGLVIETDNTDFYDAIICFLYRPANEMYIPIPKSRNFHVAHPDFFAEGVGNFEPGEKKLPLPKEKCQFKLVFEPSGDSIMAFITQDYGKAIESVEKQTYLGEWIRKGIFQLEEYQPLTRERLNEIGINAIRLYRIEGDDSVHLRFIWIDENETPDDYVGY